MTEVLANPRNNSGSASQKSKNSIYRLVIWHVWSLDAVKFDLEAMFGNDFSSCIDLEGSRGLGRAGMEVGGVGAQNTGVMISRGKMRRCKSVKWLEMGAGGFVWAQHLWILKVLMRRVDLEWFWSGKRMSKAVFFNLFIKMCGGRRHTRSV